MKISRQRFEELISLYLDNEASQEELRLLSACVRENRLMAEIFHKACRVHAITCKFYGKELKFPKLKGVKNPLGIYKKRSKTKIAGEWLGVAALMFLSFGLFTLSAKTDKLPNADAKAFMAETVGCETDFIAMPNPGGVFEPGGGHAPTYSIVQFSPKSPMVLTD